VHGGKFQKRPQHLELVFLGEVAVEIHRIETFLNELADHLQKRLRDPRSFFAGYRERNTGREELDVAFMELIAMLEKSTLRPEQIFSELVNWARIFHSSREGRVSKLFIYPAIWDYVSAAWGSENVDSGFTFEHSKVSRPKGARKPAPSGIQRSSRAVKFNCGSYKGMCCDFRLGPPLQIHLMGEIGYMDSAREVKRKINDDTYHCRKLLQSNSSPFAEATQPFDAALVLCIDASVIDWNRHLFLRPDYVQVGNDLRPIVKRVLRRPC
jgi:hypothetical protein